MKPFTESDLIDYLSGEMPREERRRLEDELESNEALSNELAEMAAMQSWIAEREEPISWTTEASILAMANEELQQQRTRRLHVSWRNWASVAAAALLLFLGGWYLGQNRASALENELADIRTQVESLIQDQRTSSRMRAVSMTQELPTVDQEMIAQLGRLLREDDSSNVQLAALEALAGYPNDLNARQQLINALAEDIPAVVQIQLIETLVTLEEVRILPQLEDWSEDESTPTHLRDAAQLARLKLSRI